MDNFTILSWNKRSKSHLYRHVNMYLLLNKSVPIKNKNVDLKIYCLPFYRLFLYYVCCIIFGFLKVDMILFCFWFWCL